MDWFFDRGFETLVLWAFLNTVLISAVVIIGSNLLALPIAIYMQRPRGSFRLLIIGYSFFMRATPVLAILFVLFYGLPRLGIYFEPIPSALIGLTLASTAYNLEFLRSGFESVADTQMEAARALGMRPVVTYWKVLIPQAYASAGPALFSNAIQIVKGSSLASLVAVDELTAASTTMIAETFKAIQVLTFIAVLYGLVAVLILALQWVYERRQIWQYPNH